MDLYYIAMVGLKNRRGRYIQKRQVEDRHMVISIKNENGLGMCEVG